MKCSSLFFSFLSIANGQCMTGSCGAPPVQVVSGPPVQVALPQPCQQPACTQTVTPSCVNYNYHTAYNPKPFAQCRYMPEDDPGFACFSPPPVAMCPGGVTPWDCNTYPLQPAQ